MVLEYSKMSTGNYICSVTILKKSFSGYCKPFLSSFCFVFILGDLPFCPTNSKCIKRPECLCAKGSCHILHKIVRKK